MFGFLKFSWPRKRSPQVLLFLNLPQDLDVLLPLAIRLRQSPGLEIKVALTDKAEGNSPRIGRLLRAAGIEPMVVSHKAAVAGLQPSLRGISALITASESTANAHKAAYHLTQRANRKGLATYTLQHGFENVGINYFDAEYPVGKVLFDSQILFTWGSLALLPTETPAQTRRKCLPVGCPKLITGFSAQGAPQVPGHPEGNRLVVVFENLHWSRYSDGYREKFLQDLAQTAADCPQVTFLVKPHHAGLWLTQRYQGQVPKAANLIIADPKAPQWEAFTAPALIELADAVITTPSTVAVDAARAKVPVAVVGYDLALPNYEPLPILRSGQDWRSLCEQAHRQNPALLAQVETFSATQLVAGDAIAKILAKLCDDLAIPRTAAGLEATESSPLLEAHHQMPSPIKAASS